MILHVPFWREFPRHMLRKERRLNVFENKLVREIFETMKEVGEHNALLYSTSTTI
jgi:hypothetical protein